METIGIFLSGLFVGVLFLIIFEWWLRRWLKDIPQADEADIATPPAPFQTRVDGEINHNIRIEHEEDEADWWKRCDP